MFYKIHIPFYYIFLFFKLISQKNVRFHKKMCDFTKNVRFHKKMCDFTKNVRFHKKCAISQKNVRFHKKMCDFTKKCAIWPFFYKFQTMFQYRLKYSNETMFRIQNFIIEKFSKNVCVCWKKYTGSLKNRKLFFRQKKLSQKSFWRKKMSEIFFQILK